MTTVFKLLLLICFLLPSAIFSQVLPPDFLCVSNDSLMWMPVTNSCGAFNAYEVYGSTNEQGPYTLLTSINDPAETIFFHADANSQLWYYYLATNANCPTEPTLYSDTLDNLIPLVEPIQNVTIVGGGVEINWYPSPSPEVYAYIISRSTDVGTIALDTVFGGQTTYFDAAADPENVSEEYFVTAIDPCGNKSLVVDPHSTILLDLIPQSFCENGIVLNWNPYQNWLQGVDRYDILVSINNEPEIVVGSVSGNTSTYTYTLANDGEELCFRVQAVENNTQVQSLSSTSCTTVDILQPLRNIELLGASVNANGTVNIEWFWDETALITDANILSHALDDDVLVIQDYTIPNPIPAFNTNTVLDINAQAFPYVFNVDGSDECDNLTTSNESITPFITVTSQGELANLLSWMPYEHELATQVNYELVRIDASGESVLFTANQGDVKFTDNNLNSGDGFENCYYLRVLVEYTLSNGQVLNRVLQSNTVCIVPEPKVYVPNVFAPHSFNNQFRPFLSFNVATNYSMNIFDRWGGHVFQSTQINNAWDGKKNGEPMPEGVYVYIIELQPDGGSLIRLSGDVMLLR